MENKNITNLVAYCGLYCGECKAYLSSKCPGCVASSKNGRCKIKSCNISKGHKSCADCQEFEELKKCKTLNNLVGKIFGLLFKSNRIACLEKIRERGYEDFAEYMAQNKLQTIKK